jgi:AGZA family xanthine/uracil permease-like MFS transporter
MASLGSGSVLVGMVLGAFAVFIIDRQLNRAAITAFIGAGLAWIGLIHGAQLGWAASPMVALGYALMGMICLAANMQRTESPGQ